MNRGRCRSAFGAAGAIATIAAGAGTAQAFTPPAGWQVAQRSAIVTVEPGVTHVQAIAIGGRGGGATGGLGALARGEFAASPGQRLVLRVGADGGLLRRTVPAGAVAAGAGGDASALGVCAPDHPLCSVLVFPRAIVAAGGGGTGAGNALLPGGAGGAAGAPGSAGAFTVFPVAVGAGGAAGVSGGGGAGGAAGVLPDGCTGISGPNGGSGGLVSGGIGGPASDPAREGGGGGDGHGGGGGGGASASCGADPAAGAGGGGGGASLVPAGGTIEVNPNPADTPLIAYTFVKEKIAPTVTVSAPADGARYVARTVVAAAYACADEVNGSGLESCTGTVAAGQPIDTAAAGTKTFTVTASDRAGNVTTTTVRYTVTAAPAPTVRGVRATSRAFRFTLSAAGQVTLRVERRRPGKRPRWAHVGTLRHKGVSGVNTVVHKGRVGRRTLAAGGYRVVIHATAVGRRSKSVTRTFTVRARR